jgi:hypothetical protein
MTRMKYKNKFQEEFYANHEKPKTRRDFVSLGLVSGTGFVLAPSLLSMLVGKSAYAADCSTSGGAGSGMAGFLCFDLAGGANIAGGNVMVGKRGGQTDALANYTTLGLLAGAHTQLNTEFGLAFQAQSPFLQGLLQGTTAPTRAKVDGAVFCTVSNDDTGNNPHNPAYWINAAGAKGELVSLLGTSNSDSGGRSQAPAASINAGARPVQITKPADALSLVRLGKLADMLGSAKAEKVLKAVERMSSSQLAAFNAKDFPDQVRELVACGYIKSSEMLSKFKDPNLLDASRDTAVTTAFNNLANAEQALTASLSKLVIDGYAGAGTVQLGGFDYHNGTRATGNARDVAAGQMVGRALELARLKEKNLVIYVFTDGGVTSNGTPDGNANGTPIWTGDNAQRSAAFMLAYTHSAKTKTRDVRQIGAYNNVGAVDTTVNKISDNVENLAKAVTANYLALHGKEGDLAKVVGTDPFGSELDQYLVFQKSI